MKPTRRSLKITLAAIAAIFIALVATRPLEAIIIINSRLANFGYVGLGQGQMARIHLFNHANPDGDSPCLAGLRLFDDANNVVAESSAALKPGESTDLSYRASVAQKVRAIVAAVGPKGGKSCSASFEIVDRNGKTTIFTNTADVSEHNYQDIADWGAVRFNER